MPGGDRRGRWFRRAVVGTLGAAVPLAALTVSPWPSALLIRRVFDRGSARASAALARHVPDGVTARLGVVRDAADPDGLVDVFRPSGAAGPLPTIVWVHGGGWVSGRRGDVAGYARVLAARGFTVVTVDYSIAPEARYPTPVRQVADALGFLVADAADLGVDPDRIVLAGSSAGAQIAAQVAAMVSDPGYAAAVGIAVPLDRSALCAVVLHCGGYDLDRAHRAGWRGWFLRTVLWSYTGTRAFADDPGTALASVLHHVTADFPPAFLSSGNADPLLPHSEDLAARLVGLGVEVEALFFPADRAPALGHEYQFGLDDPGGVAALDRSVEFVRRHTAGGPVSSPAHVVDAPPASGHPARPADPT